MILICIKIFFARILDVSIGTVRTIFTIEGKKVLSTILAFFEVLVWFYVAREAINGDFGPYVPFAYAGGYATGTLVGILINDLVNHGKMMLTVITAELDMTLCLEKNDIKYSLVNLENSFDNLERKMLLIFIDKKSVSKTVNLIRKYDPQAVITSTSTNIVERKEL